MTLGEKRIRIDFNGSGDSDVELAKICAAKFIDVIDDMIPNPVDSEQARLKALALTAIEEASMWAVKALSV